MKAHHVVTGRDRDKAYKGIFSGVCFLVIGVALLSASVPIGLIVIGLSVLGIYGAAQRLRGDI